MTIKKTPGLSTGIYRRDKTRYTEADIPKFFKKWAAKRDPDKLLREIEKRTNKFIAAYDPDYKGKDKEQLASARQTAKDVLALLASVRRMRECGDVDWTMYESIQLGFAFERLQIQASGAELLVAERRAQRQAITEENLKKKANAKPIHPERQACLEETIENWPKGVPQARGLVYMEVAKAFQRSTRQIRNTTEWPESKKDWKSRT